MSETGNKAMTIGRIVHFVDESGNEWPAIINRGHENSTTVDLKLFDDSPGSAIQRNDIPMGLPGQHKTWHWPERVEG